MSDGVGGYEYVSGGKPQLDGPGEAVGAEGKAAAVVELVLELDPVEAEGVQEALHAVHAQQHPERDPREQHEADDLLSGLTSTRGMPR